MGVFVAGALIAQLQVSCGAESRTGNAGGTSNTSAGTAGAGLGAGSIGGGSTGAGSSGGPSPGGTGTAGAGVAAGGVGAGAAPGDAGSLPVGGSFSATPDDCMGLPEQCQPLCDRPVWACLSKQGLELETNVDFEATVVVPPVTTGDFTNALRCPGTTMQEIPNEPTTVVSLLQDTGERWNLTFPASLVPADRFSAGETLHVVYNFDLFGEYPDSVMSVSDADGLVAFASDTALLPPSLADGLLLVESGDLACPWSLPDEYLCSRSRSHVTLSTEQETVTDPCGSTIAGLEVSANYFVTRDPPESCGGPPGTCDVPPELVVVGIRHP